MNDQNLKTRIKQAAQENVPDVRSRVLAQAKPSTQGTRHPYRYAFAGALAVMLLALIALWPATVDVYATVHLDVNPSIAIDLDDEERILEVRALNDDAQLLLSSIDVASFDTLEELIDAIIDEAIARGIMTEDRPFVMIDITGDDAAFVEGLYGHLSHRIPEHAMGRIPNVEVIRGHSHDAVPDEVARAREHGMNVQRLRLIDALVDATDYDFDTLKAMQINELVQLARDHDVDTDRPGPPHTPGPPNQPGPPH